MAKSRSHQRSGRTSSSGTSSPRVSKSGGKSKSSRSNKASSPGSGRRPSSVGDSLESLEAEIRRIDTELISLVSRRAGLVRQIGSIQAGPVAGRVAAGARGARELVEAIPSEEAVPSREALADVLRHVSSICLQSLHHLRVAYLGPVHSYSHLAAMKYFGEGANLVPVASIPAVFDAVSRHDAVAGVVPIENSTDGRVVDTLGMFIRRKMQICGEVLLPIHHNLLSRTPRHEITEVYSKPQALSQCRGWLANQLPHAQLIEVSSTAAAARLAAEKPGAAAVASLEAGRGYELDVIDANIEDNSNNVTRFAVLGREQLPATGDDKTALLFQVKHEPGALAEAMAIFKRAGLNLTWIESFPIPEKQSEYLFFVELTGHHENPSVTAAIESLGKRTERLEVLGSYPRAMAT